MSSAQGISSSISERQSLDDEKKHHATAEYCEVDAAAGLSVQGSVDLVESLRVRRKIDRHILPLMCVVYWISFMDTSTLGNSAVLGLKKSTHLTAAQYNWLGTIYYLSLLAFEYPQNLALQRYPVGKWLSINIFIWGATVCLQAACRDFGGLFALRFILGMCEGCITTGFMIVTAMFYTRREQTLRIGYWFLMNGVAEIVSGFLAFGAAHIETAGLQILAKSTRGSTFASFGQTLCMSVQMRQMSIREYFWQVSVQPWQWLVIIIGSLTLIISICYWIFFPDSPTNAWFLTPEERLVAVNRLKANQTGIENKRFKREQVIECLTDTKTWIFALYAIFRSIPNSLINQNSLIINSFGFTVIQTTLLSCVTGVIKMSSAYTGVNLAVYFNNIAYVGVGYYVPAVVGAILVNSLPWSNKAGLLVSEYIVGIEAVGAPLMYAWVTQTTAGHTKRITMNAILLITDGLGNAIGPQIWADKFAPRYHIPWAIVAISYSVALVLLLIQRYMLNKENKKRDLEPPNDEYDDVWIKLKDENGGIIEKKVDKAFLDLTDGQNRDFRYVL